MKKIKLYYADIRNMGDQLNRLLFQDYFGLDIQRSNFLIGECSAIGSGLDQYLFHGNARMRRAQRWYGILKPSVVVWGTGFINYPGRKEELFLKKNMQFAAVRGELSRKRAEQLLGRRIDVPTGDAGILASELLRELPEKKYDIGIIPHVCDAKEEKLRELLEEYDNAVLIRLTDEPYHVIRQIASCRTILSSSLHGLVVADSFGIPNQHVVVSGKPLGDGFKFDDYYSAYGVEHRILDLRKEKNHISLEQIISAYRITEQMVWEKKRELLDVFPYKNLTSGVSLSARQI
ncbi:MAG: polysaccharide pyruvyl transferase family protein [Hespellia sp.]|nr:polysaccharide pyruvyl transferase family protein [Hespellia sp.]